MKPFCKTIKALAALMIFGAASLPVFSQNNTLPKGYRKIELGMDLETVKDQLKRDIQFGYRGDRDVSLLPGGNSQTLIETDTSRTAPYSFLERCWFQFNDDRLYIITINIKRSKMDHHSIFKTLCQKYGNPVSLDPEKSVWMDENVIMTLERPLTLKYTDRKVFEQMQEEAGVQKSIIEESRDSFLNGL